MYRSTEGTDKGPATWIGLAHGSAPPRATRCRPDEDLSVKVMEGESGRQHAVRNTNSRVNEIGWSAYSVRIHFAGGLCFKLVVRTLPTLFNEWPRIDERLSFLSTQTF